MEAHIKNRAVPPAAFDTPEEVAQSLHSLCYLYSMNLETVALLQKQLDVVELVLARREWQLTPPDGWEGKNPEQRKMSRSSALWEDARLSRAGNRRAGLIAAIRLSEANAKSASRSISAYQSIAALMGIPHLEPLHSDNSGY